MSLRFYRDIPKASLTAEDIELKDLTNQKMSALLKQLVDANQVEKTKDKKATLFGLAE